MVKSYLRWLPLLLGTLLLAACNLGQGVPTGDITPTADLFIPAELPTSTPDPNAPPPTIEGFAPAADSVGESLGPVTVTGELVTLELVTIPGQTWRCGYWSELPGDSSRDELE